MGTQVDLSSILKSNQQKSSYTLFIVHAHPDDECSSTGGLIIKSIKENFKIPVMAYQVSGEYSLLENAINKGLIDNNAILESLIAFKRAGASAIVTYYADRLDNILEQSS